jgi:hypothetical protein
VVLAGRWDLAGLLEHPGDHPLILKKVHHVLFKETMLQFRCLSFTAHNY